MSVVLVIIGIVAVLFFAAALKYNPKLCDGLIPIYITTCLYIIMTLAKLNSAGLLN